MQYKSWITHIPHLNSKRCAHIQKVYLQHIFQPKALGQCSQRTTRHISTIKFPQHSSSLHHTCLLYTLTWNSRRAPEFCSRLSPPKDLNFWVKLFSNWLIVIFTNIISLVILSLSHYIVTFGIFMVLFASKTYSVTHTVRVCALGTVSCRATLHLNKPKEAQKFASNSFRTQIASSRNPAHRSNQKEVDSTRNKPLTFTTQYHELPKTKAKCA